MIKKLLLVFLLITNFCFAQITIKVVSIPKNTPEKAVIFIAGNFNNWTPSDSAYKLTQNYKGEYFIDLPIHFGNYEFKFTLGSWNTTEMSSEGGDISNHILKSTNDTVVNFEVSAWKSIEVNAASPQASNSFVLSEKFPMKQLNKTRRIWVYLPQDYQTRLNKNYPVLYMQDGQNLFSSSTAANGEWEVDETLVNLENKGDSGIIVIGIDNGGIDRIDEYSPWNNPEYGGGKGNKYLDFIVHDLKPVIDLLYRTKADRSHTGIMGSSMGAIVPLYAAYRYEDVFSKFGVFSPSIWFSDSVYSVAAHSIHKKPAKIYLMSGILESSTQAQETYNLRDTLLLHGYSKNEIRCEIKNDGTHSEWFWKREFADCITWLFDSTDATNLVLETPSNSTSDFEIELIADKNLLAVKTIGLTGSSIIVVKNQKGNIVAKKHINSTGSINLSKLGKGVYSMQLTNGNYTSSKAFEKK